jgi:hypothetical protein
MSCLACGEFFCNFKTLQFHKILSAGISIHEYFFLNLRIKTLSYGKDKHSRHRL